MSTRFVERLFAACSERAEAEAVVFAGQSMTFGELDRSSRRYARGLANLGIVRGDRIAVFSEAGPEVLVALLGNYRIGAIHVPINTRYRAEEAGHILRDSGARAALIRAGSPCAAVLQEVQGAGNLERTIVIGAQEMEKGTSVSFESLLESEEVPAEWVSADEDIALLIYTSGTTGKSKGAALSYRAVASNIDALTGLWRFSSEDRLVLALPLFHVHGLCIGVHAALIHGTTLLLFERFEAREVVRAFGEMRATVFLGVPTMYVRLLELVSEQPQAAEALRRGRLFTSGSAALSTNEFEQFEKVTGHRILERYGMTETLFTLSNPYEGERRPGTVGHPVPGCAIKIVDEKRAEVADGSPGEILVRGDSLMTEYWGRPGETAAAFQAGWFATGDVATRDPDGYVRILGRQSVDIIKSGGFKISAREIEDVLREHPCVQDVAVLGVPDRVWGERIVAAVVSKSDRTGEIEPPILREELVSFCANRLADYKCPREVRILSELPRNAMGKVQKNRILEELGLSS